MRSINSDEIAAVGGLNHMGEVNPPKIVEPNLTLVTFGLELSTTDQSQLILMVLTFE